MRYRVDARPRAINACHCLQCKKLTGATHLLMLLVDTEAFVHEQGEVARYRKIAESGREVDIVRCAACGVRLWHEPLSSPEFRFVAAGTLDDPSWALPTSHIWVRSISPTILIDYDCHVVDGQPASRQELITAFNIVYGTGA